MKNIFVVVEKNNTNTSEVVESLNGGEFIDKKRIVNLLKKKGIERVDIEFFESGDFMKYLNNLTNFTFNRSVALVRVFQ
jgi:predicted membrane GTPase involved in stress response